MSDKPINITMSPQSRQFIDDAANDSYECMTVNSSNARMFLLGELMRARRMHRQWLDEVKDESFEDDTLARLDTLVMIAGKAKITKPLNNEENGNNTRE
jgi:hypothetical protein